MIITNSLIFFRKCIFFAFVFWLPFYAIAQDQKVADSLLIIYKSKNLNNSNKMELLRNLAFNETNNLDLSLRYSEQLIELAQQEKNYLYLYRGYNLKGNKKSLKGDFNEAISSYFKGVEAANKAKYPTGEGTCYIGIANTYSTLKNANNAEFYYSKSIQILRQTKEPILLATALLNAGDELYKNLKLEDALHHFQEAGSIFKTEKYLIGSAYTIGNIGMVYAKQGHDKLAIENINKAISILEKQEDFYGISDYLTYMSEIYYNKNDLKTAIIYAKRSMAMAEKQGLKEQVRKSSLQLSELYRKDGDIYRSFAYYKKYIVYRDSINNLESMQKMADIRTNAEVSQKQLEVDILNQQKKNQKIITIASLVSLFLVFLLALGLYRRYQFVNKTNIIIESEKNKSNALLLNILPEETALELKESGKVLAKKFDSVTVLFTDFVDFTNYAENLSPEKLVESVDYYFSKFDEIIEKHDLEKIKTVGDSYMCAGGLPYPTEDHAYRMVLAAIDIVDFVYQSNLENPLNQTRFKIRVGINTGPVVAGVVGTKKFAYDIWGDTVNIASRMESNSTPGEINISENTYSIIKDDFDCEYRGEIEVKNRGMLKMYFVNGKSSQEI